jgi:hypothetical protein
MASPWSSSTGPRPTGNRSLAEVARYTKAADQQRLARQALDIQLRTEGEQKLSNLDTRLDKTGSK